LISTHEQYCYFPDDQPCQEYLREGRIQCFQIPDAGCFASIIGGTCTLIGTSTNIAVSGYLKTMNMDPLNMFEFSAVGAILLVVTVVYMMTISKRLLPNREIMELQEDYQLRDYLSELVIQKDSTLVGQSVSKSTLAQSGFSVLGMVGKVSPRKLCYA
ncbi:MAG: SLC13 family permease, partial [Chitinophagales bacterium]